MNKKYKFKLINGASAMWLAIGAWGVLFAGDPDMVDAIIHYLMNQ